MSRMMTPLLLLAAAVLFAGGLFAPVSLADNGAALAAADRAQAGPGAAGWIDTHMHPSSGPFWRALTLSTEVLDRVLPIFDRLGVAKAVLLFPPDPRPRGVESDNSLLSRVAQSRSPRFVFLGGGLQPLVQEAAAGGMTSDLRNRIEEKTAELVRLGAVGFGEMTALHFSFRPGHPFVETLPDTPGFLLLADLAARQDVVIDLHMEAVTREMPTPERLLDVSRLNPPRVRENIRALERLLAHNRRARIVWAHIGWDNTGDLTVALLRRLLSAHPNLYLQLRIPQRPGDFPQNTLLDPDGRIRPEWLELIWGFPDRFVMGSDTFIARADFEGGLRATASLVAQLPADLVGKVGIGNALAIYRLRMTAGPTGAFKRGGGVRP